MTARHRWITGCLAATALAPIAIGALASPALADSDQVTKVTICHATSSATNPFVVIRPASPAVLHAHVNHHDGGDIVPPFSYRGVDYPGENWTAEGKALSENGCMAQAPPPVLTPPPVLDPPELTPPPPSDDPVAEEPVAEEPPSDGTTGGDTTGEGTTGEEPPAENPPSVFGF